MSPGPELEPMRVDVGDLVQRTVASLYSCLVTRPTGRAVRLAIESQIAGGARRTLSLLDFSEVRVLDFSCADEVVAKLLLGSVEDGEDPDAFFVFRGVREIHMDPIEAVLRRHALAAVVETVPGPFRLLGRRSAEEVRIWRKVEEAGDLPPATLLEHFPDENERRVLEELGRRRLILPLSGGGYRALSTLVHGVPD